MVILSSLHTRICKQQFQHALQYSSTNVKFKSNFVIFQQQKLKHDLVIFNYRRPVCIL